MGVLQNVVSGIIMGDLDNGWHYLVTGLSYRDVRPTRTPRQVIGSSSASSVVTSVTIVESRNYVGVKQNERNKKPVKKRPDKTPRFEFYLYNDAGRIIKQYLTIHEIQQILLQQSQSLGLKQLGWLIGRNESDWTSSSSKKSSTRRPTTTFTPSRSTTRRTTTGQTQTPGTTNKSQLLGVIDMVQGIVASAQDTGDQKDEKIKTKNKNKNKNKNKKNRPRTPSTTRKTSSVITTA